MSIFENMAIEINDKSISIQGVQANWLKDNDIQLSILRLDQIDPVISGNKWFKLKENIRSAESLDKTALLTFGGIWSNHLLATAAAANRLGFQSIGMVRATGQKPCLTTTLKSCQQYGMQLVWLKPTEYRLNKTALLTSNLSRSYPEAFIIPEGGNNAAGIQGAAEITNFIPKDKTTHVVLPVGTGSTFSGIRKTLASTIKIYGFAPFKKTEEQRHTISSACPTVPQSSWQLFKDGHWQGFGRYDVELITFLNNFYSCFQIPLDIVYTGKMMFYLQREIQKGLFPAGSKIVAIHTGGLQGNASIADKLVYKIPVS